MCGDTSVRANFGDLLRRARREAGLTQEELAESAGLSARGISDIERGIHRVPRRDTLELLAHALQRPITDLENWRTSTRHNTQRLEDPATGAFPAPDLIGRDGEFQRLRDSIDRARSGRGRVTLLAGEPGVGKTRLATDVAGYAETQGMQVVWGLSHEEEGAPAYWPWIQILRGVTEPLSAEQMEADLGRGAGVIAQILPEITDTLADVRDSESTAS